MKKLLEKINNKERKKIVIEIVSVLVLMTLFIGVSIAGGYWSYKSSTANTLETGSVSMTFLESNSVIDITNALPKSDNAGKTQTDLFEFAVTTNSGAVQTISYDISIEPIIVETGYTGLNPEDIKVYLTDKEGNVLVNPTKLSDLNNFKLYSNKHKHITEDTRLTSKYVLRAWIDSGVRATDWYKEYTDSNIRYQYKFRVNVNGKSIITQDTSGANAPVLSDNMIPVYYDETAEVWKKADSENENSAYKWYDYNNKMWANSVTVSETNRSTYLSADPGTEIPMDDILTMQVWIPRYKYKVWNYNADGTATSEPQEIEIAFESGTATTGEITCSDSISGTDGAVSETCKLKSTNATCTDSTCNNKTYTHPAFTFGSQELEGIWVGKFEVSAPTDNTCYTSASEANCNKTGITPLVKPDVKSYRDAQVGTFESNMMAMNDSGNIYGFATTDDTHMMKNMEWGAVAYLSHSKYGTCTEGTCTEININNSSGYYTGRSGGNVGGQTSIKGTYTDQTSTTQYNSYGFYTYDGYLLNYNTNTKSSTKDMTKIASTTGNIYGVYDMSGGAYEYVMGNIVSNDGTTMMSGTSTSINSGYTGIVYDSGNYISYTGTYSYQENKYIDKYSFGTSSTQKKRSKLGDAIKEVTATSSTGWYSDYGYVASASGPWFLRGGYINNGALAGVMPSYDYDGLASSFCSARVVVLAP